MTSTLSTDFHISIHLLLFFFECWCIFPHLGLYLLVLLGPFFRSKLQRDVLSIHSANKRITGNFRPLMSIQLGIAWKDLRFAIRWKFYSPIFLSGMIFTISLYCIKNAPTCPEMKLGYLVNGDICPSLSWLLHILTRATLFSVGGGIMHPTEVIFPENYLLDVDANARKCFDDVFLRCLDYFV